MDIQMDFKPDQKQLLVLVGLACLIVFIIDFSFFLRPYTMQVFGSASILNKMGTDFRSAQSDISKIDMFKKEIEECEGKVSFYEKKLPVEQEIPKLLESLSNIARDSNIKILGITPIQNRPGSNAGGQIYQEIPILINAKCGYHELGRFLSNLENSDRFMKVADLAVRSNKQTPKKHDVELLVLTYILLKGK